MEDSKEKKLKIKEQIEYYLGDDNLKKDSFFHQRISADPNGYLELDCLLKCNKIKQSGWTKEDLIEGIKLSDELELNKEENKVRRKNNKPLPELSYLSKKRKKNDEEEGKKKETFNEEELKDPVILKINCKEATTVSWKDINDEFKKANPELKVVYGRFKEKEGHFAIILKPNEELKFNDKFVIQKSEFQVIKCEGEDLVNFWKDHGSHYEFCLKDKRNKKNKKEKGKGKNKSKSTYLENPVTLGGQKYTDITLVKAEARKILNNCKDGEPLKDKDKDFMLDLLKYHHNYEEKSKDLDFITVGKPEEYKYSRCFIITNKNKTKTDFSFQKCIDNLYDKCSEKKE